MNKVIIKLKNILLLLLLLDSHFTTILFRTQEEITEMQSKNIARTAKIMTLK